MHGHFIRLNWNNSVPEKRASASPPATVIRSARISRGPLFRGGVHRRGRNRDKVLSRWNAGTSSWLIGRNRSSTHYCRSRICHASLNARAAGLLSVSPVAVSTIFRGGNYNEICVTTMRLPRSTNVVRNELPRDPEWKRLGKRIASIWMKWNVADVSLFRRGILNW